MEDFKNFGGNIEFLHWLDSNRVEDLNVRIAMTRAHTQLFIRMPKERAGAKDVIRDAKRLRRSIARGTALSDDEKRDWKSKLDLLVACQNKQLEFWEKYLGQEGSRLGPRTGNIGSYLWLPALVIYTQFITKKRPNWSWITRYVREKLGGNLSAAQPVWKKMRLTANRILKKPKSVVGDSLVETMCLGAVSYLQWKRTIEQKPGEILKWRPLSRDERRYVCLIEAKMPFLRHAMRTWRRHREKNKPCADSG